MIIKFSNQNKSELKKYQETEDSFRSCLLLYTVLFFIAAAGVFSWFVMEGKSFCWTTDAVSQYIPKAAYFIRYMKDWLQRILAGDFTFQMYDFSIGYGDAVVLHTEPLYWLFLLFDEKNVEYAYAFIMLVRFYLAGVSMSVFCCYFKYGKLESAIGSLVYVFSGYSLFACMRHAHFMVAMIMLPLLLLCVEELLEKKRWYLCTICVAISFFCGFYFTYMSTFTMGIYFLLRYFGRKEKKSIRDFCVKMFSIIGSYSLGIGISNITLFNTFAGYLTSSRTGTADEAAVSMLSYGSNWVFKVFMSFLSSEYHAGKWLWLGFAVITYFCILLLFMRRGNWQLKIAFLLGTVFCMIPLFAFVFGGFGPITNRWSFSFGFVIALITAKMIRELLSLTKKELAGLFLGCLPYLYLGVGKFLLHKDYVRSVRDAGILLLMTWLLLLLLHLANGMSSLWKMRILTVSILVSLWFVGAFRFSPYYGDMISEFADAGTVYEAATDTPLKVYEDHTDEEFYRVYSKVTKSNVQGASMMLGFDGILYFSSTIGKPVIDFYRDLGLTSWSLVRLRGLDGRGYLNALAGVAYEVMKSDNPYDVPYGYSFVEETEKDGKSYLVYKNSNALPFGYTYDQSISLEEFEKLPTLLRQEVMLHALVLDNKDADDAISSVTAEDIQSGAMHLDGKNVSITDFELSDGIEYDGNTIKVTKKKASITFYFDGLENSETYLTFHNLHMNNASQKWFDITSDSDNYKITYYLNGDKHTYSTKQEDYIFHLGYAEEGKTYCKITFRNKCTLTFDEISIFCQPMKGLDQAVLERSADQLENLKFDINTITGTIEAKKDEYLVLNMPYDTGWTAYVDGEKTELLRENLMFTGLLVSEGSHTIELHYEIPGIRISVVISLLSLILFFALLLRRRRSDIR